MVASRSYIDTKTRLNIGRGPIYCYTDNKKRHFSLFLACLRGTQKNIDGLLLSPGRAWFEDKMRLTCLREERYKNDFSYENKFTQYKNRESTHSISPFHCDRLKWWSSIAGLYKVNRIPTFKAQIRIVSEN